MRDMDDLPGTAALRRALLVANDSADRSDLLFLATWERQHPANLGATLRAGQIRRANPGLAAAIEQAVKRGEVPPALAKEAAAV